MSVWVLKVDAKNACTMTDAYLSCCIYTVGRTVDIASLCLLEVVIRDKTEYFFRGRTSAEIPFCIVLFAVDRLMRIHI